MVCEQGGGVEFISEAPKIEIFGSVARVVARSGERRIERVMSIPSFVRFIERGQRALRRHAAGDEIIIVDD